MAQLIFAYVFNVQIVNRSQPILYQTCSGILKSGFLKSWPIIQSCDCPLGDLHDYLATCYNYMYFDYCESNSVNQTVFDSYLYL